MEASPGIVRRRIQEMSSNFQGRDRSPPRSSQNQPSSASSKPHNLRKLGLQQPFQSRSSSSLANHCLNQTARPFKKIYSSPDPAVRSSWERSRAPTTVPGSSSQTAASKLLSNDYGRKDVRSHLLAPKPFRCSTDQILRDAQLLEQAEEDEPPPILPRRSDGGLSTPDKPVIPPKPKHFGGPGDGRSEVSSSPEASDRKSSRSEASPPPTLSERDQNDISAEVADELSPLPYIVKRTRSTPNNSLTTFDIDKDINRKLSESPLNTSFAKFNQRVQKLDLLKRRQSYSEFEELIEKKRELRERMMTKIFLLREERDFLIEEKRENDVNGFQVLQALEKVANQSEVDKYRHFLEEIEQITKLTVGLTIRLSRLNKRLEDTAPQLSPERLMQEERKKKRLIDQTKEAEFLHRNTDRRSIQVRKMLSRHLDEENISTYDEFLANLIKHLTDLKETEQRIQLGEEQLVALNDNILEPASSPVL